MHMHNTLLEHVSSSYGTDDSSKFCILSQFPFTNRMHAMAKVAKTSQLILELI